MHLKKAILSILLLFTYTIGLAHNLIPHCHHDNATEKLLSEPTETHQHLHEHHTHTANEAVEHEHITHENHLDEGLLDFIICILSETQHPSSDNTSCFYFPIITNDVSAKSIAKANLAVLLIALYSDRNEETTTYTYPPEVSATYLSPPLSNSPHRGPPSFSC